MERMNFAPIAEAIESLGHAINGMYSELRVVANSQREEALALKRRMLETHEDFITLATITQHGALMLATASDSVAQVGGTVYQAIDSSFNGIPTVNYEDFVGFCSECGACVHAQDSYDVIDGMLLCPDCTPIEDDEDEVVEFVADEALDAAVNAETPVEVVAETAE